MPKLLRSILAIVVVAETVSLFADEPPVIDLGARRELFVDEYLVDEYRGKAELRLQHPVPREIVLKHDAPWEGNATAYHSLFKDGDKYRLYYRAWNLGESFGSITTSQDSLCYAESDDGIHWTKPELGLNEFDGSTANNIAISTPMAASFQAKVGGPAVFRDDNPAVPTDERYKAFLIADEPLGMLPFKSSDGIHFTPMTDHPVITNGAFDSQNLAFWDAERKAYRAYWRYFTGGTTDAKTWEPTGIRAIRTATSSDLVSWNGDDADLVYEDSPPEELYENGIHPYYRAPHLLIGLPVRYVDRAQPGADSIFTGKADAEKTKRWPPSLRALPQLGVRELKASMSERYGSAITEALFMVSRDGVNFKRWNEAFIRPGIERDGTWNYGQLFVAWTPVETKSTLDDSLTELSFYATEGYWSAPYSSLRRYTLRLDGFVSLSAPMSGGELVTKPIVFSGKELSLNFASSAAGGLKVEIQDDAGGPIVGFSENEGDELFGDTTDRIVSWNGKTDVSSLAGKPVRLRFILRDADVYSFQFRE
ncbi:MAG: hypothetical protein O3A29_03535 [Planctomycetota bacterium]|nr:hypothetical protein [Planctomycetota bacterium]